MIESILSDVCTDRSFEYRTGSARQFEDLLSSECTFPIVWLYPYQIQFEAPDYGVRMEHRYTATLDIVMAHKPEDPRDKILNRLQYMRARADELIHGVLGHASCETFSGDMVQVFRGGEALDKGELSNGYSKALVGWNIKMNITVRPESEIDYCTDLSTSEVTLEDCP